MIIIYNRSSLQVCRSFI